MCVRVCECVTTNNTKPSLQCAKKRIVSPPVSVSRQCTARSGLVLIFVPRVPVACRARSSHRPRRLDAFDRLARRYGGRLIEYPVVAVVGAVDNSGGGFVDRDRRRRLDGRRRVNVTRLGCAPLEQHLGLKGRGAVRFTGEAWPIFELAQCATAACDGLRGRAGKKQC